MTGAPDVLGMLLERASGVLDAQGVRYTVQVTLPPRGPRPEGPYRVIRQVPGSDGVESLVVAPTRGEHRIQTS